MKNIIVSDINTSLSRRHRGAKTALSLCFASLVSLWSSALFAQTTTALQDTTCVGTRGGNLTCTAGEFAVLPAFSASPGSPTFCTAGDQLNLNVSIQLSGSNTNRYDIGFFTGQIGNDPRSNTAGNICSAAVVPPASFPGGTNPWYDDDGDTCGDLHETTPPPATDAVTWTVQNIKVLCQGTTSALSVPYVLSYDQTSSFQASCGATNVKNGAPSKCNSGSAGVTVGVIPLRVGGYVDITKQTRPDGDTQSFLYTASGPVGTFLGYSINGGTITSVGDNTIDTADNVTITDGQTLRVYMSVTATTQTLTITEQPDGQPTHWQNDAVISCASVTGSPAVTTNNGTRVITAALNTTNSATACTVTNTKRARLSLVKNVIRRIAAADQFTIAVSGAGSTSLTSTAGASIAAASSVTVTTTGAATGNYTNATHPTFRVTPDQQLIITDAMEAGSPTALSMHESLLTCTNAFTGSGASTGLPNNLETYSYNLTPAPDDDITCTFSNKGRLSNLTISKTNAITSSVSGGTTTYTIRVSNAGPDSVTGAVISDPASTGLTVTAIACSASPGQCTPGSTPTIVQLQAGYALPAIGSGEFYEIIVNANVVATGL